MLLLITSLLLAFAFDFAQNRLKQTAEKSMQQILTFSTDCMSDFYTYDSTPQNLLTKNGRLGHTYKYTYDIIQQYAIVDDLLSESNMTNFASNGNDKCIRSNG
ncbi:MAG: hypothetical protein AB7V36_08730 [Bacteroidales bacterium]